MKNPYFVLMFCIATISSAQSKITVKASGNSLPISGAVVSCNKKILGITNSEGILTFRTNCKKVDVKAPGYLEDEAVTDKVMELVLAKNDPSVRTIEAITLTDKSDPRALEILRKVNENYAQNSPKSLDSYAYKSYEKISYDLDEDSIKAYNSSYRRRADSIKRLGSKETDANKIQDSVNEEDMMKLMGASKLFIWERAQEFLYSKKYGEKINVLDNRVSGLQEPLYELMTLRSNRNREPKEIRKENRGLYRFFLTDTIDIEGRKNFVIRFRQIDYKQPVQRRKFNGYLYIDTETYALKKIESNSKIKSDGSITSIWKPINNKWFLSKENLKLKAGSMFLDQKEYKDPITGKTVPNRDREKFGNYIFISTDYFDQKTPAELSHKDFRGYTMSVKNADGTLLDMYRTEPLTEREKNTYTKIDSLGEAKKIDQKAGLISALLKGKYQVGNVDFDAAQLLKYNLYEGLRLGVGAKLNEKFNKYISPDAYAAYGFKDRNFKYGAGVDVRTTLDKNSLFRVEYYDDVMAAGRFSENLWNFKMKIMNSGIDMKNDRFYHYKGFRASYENDISNGLTARITAFTHREEAFFDYNYRGLGNYFKNNGAVLTLKYSPNSKNIMTPSGKYTFEQNFPEYFFNYKKSVGGDFNYNKFDVLYNHNFKTQLGISGIRLYAGLISGEAPIWEQFQMNGLGSGTENSFNFNLTSYLGFATMKAGKYYNDKFAGYYFTHQLPFYFKSFGKNTSSFNLLYRGVIGDMKNPEYHQMDFEKLNHLYQEVGLEYNNFLSTQFNLGFFYRVGHYATPNFKENFAVQFKFKFLGF